MKSRHMLGNPTTHLRDTVYTVPSLRCTKRIPSRQTDRQTDIRGIQSRHRLNQLPNTLEDKVTYEYEERQELHKPCYVICMSPICLQTLHVTILVIGPRTSYIPFRRVYSESTPSSPARLGLRSSSFVLRSSLFATYLGKILQERTPNILTSLLICRTIDRVSSHNSGTAFLAPQLCSFFHRSSNSRHLGGHLHVP
jgi:hypothetical protein